MPDHLNQITELHASDRYKVVATVRYSVTVVAESEATAMQLVTELGDYSAELPYDEVVVQAVSVTPEI